MKNFDDIKLELLCPINGEFDEIKLYRDLKPSAVLKNILSLGWRGITKDDYNRVVYIPGKLELHPNPISFTCSEEDFNKLAQLEGYEKIDCVLAEHETMQYNLQGVFFDSLLCVDNNQFMGRAFYDAVNIR